MTELPAQNTRITYDPVADIPREDGKLTQLQPAIPGGGPKNQLAQDIPISSENLRADVPTRKSFEQVVSEHWARDSVQRDAVLNPDLLPESQLRQEAYQQGEPTVQDELIDLLESRYSEEFVNQGVLNNIQDKSPEEQVRLITAEYMRYASDKENTRNLLALNMLRQGLGNAPVTTLDKIHMDLTPYQTRALYDQYGRIQQAEVQRALDHIAAQEGVGYTADVALGEMVYQDLIPFIGAISRVLVTRKFLPEDIEIGAFRSILPGEIRQEIREWWAAASHEERLDYVKGIQKEWDRIRKGENSKWYTRYVTIENLMGIFTDEVLNNQDPTDTLDRVLGNLDVALGGILAVGSLTKRGLSIFDLWKVQRTNQSHNLAEAGGSRVAQEEFNKVIHELAPVSWIRQMKRMLPLYLWMRKGTLLRNCWNGCQIRM